MRVLVLDTSTAAVTAGVVDVDPAGGAVVVTEHVVVDARRHGELLAVGLRKVLTGPVEAVVVGVGPGPFTGLRVGIVTAAAFADARAIPALGVCSLDGLSSPGCGVVTDARRREVYWARYDGAGRRVDGPHVGPAAAAAAGLQGAGTIVGAGTALYPEAFDGLPVAAGPRFPTVARLAEVAVRRQLAGEPPLALTPLYLRRPDVQEPSSPKRVTATLATG